MAFDVRDRRRVTLAVIVTLISAPVIALASAGSDQPTTTAPVEVVEDGQAADQSTERANLPPAPQPGDAPPAFMDGVELQPGSQTVAIAVPPQPGADVFTTTASFSSEVPAADRCQVSGSIPTGRTITIVNVDNGRSVTCRTLLGPANQREPIVLHTTAFATLADLTDAPIPVEVRG